MRHHSGAIRSGPCAARPAGGPSGTSAITSIGSGRARRSGPRRPFGQAMARVGEVLGAAAVKFQRLASSAFRGVAAAGRSIVMALHKRLARRSTSAAGSPPSALVGPTPFAWHCACDPHRVERKRSMPKPASMPANFSLSSAITRRRRAVPLWRLPFRPCRRRDKKVRRNSARTEHLGGERGAIGCEFAAIPSKASEEINGSAKARTTERRWAVHSGGRLIRQPKHLADRAAQAGSDVGRTKTARQTIARNVVELRRPCKCFRDMRGASRRNASTGRVHCFARAIPTTMRHRPLTAKRHCAAPSGARPELQTAEDLEPPRHVIEQIFFATEEVRATPVMSIHNPSPPTCRFGPYRWRQRASFSKGAMRSFFGFGGALKN